ncbi:hypothetical protein H2201_004621 [Coniosporium apollinis]|uniref:SET domain-containing protein n=1 Tax=Coniosporium apollinis TaxID=61459 RepID=A0ABQ9NVN5_9PEZI|nr:hypothetical protein H2201_004621 [Coniosporium apollinis]
MIRRGRVEGWLRLPISAFKPWADLNGVTFNGIKVGPLPGHEDRGSTVIAERALSDGEDPLMVVPRDLVLSLEGVQIHARSDRNLQELLDALGDFGRTARGSILVFLLMQATAACPSVSKGVAVRSPLTDYIKFLPEELLPTFWTEAELNLLEGTTLKPAIEAKLKSLNREYEQLRSASEDIEWCQKYWWDEDTGMLSFDDWLQVDAMYRSRALEFPGIGDCMVPCVDMANHASGEGTVALYETDGQGNAVLLLRDDKRLEAGDEITITYGDEKGACEMVFSYGFIEDSMTSARELFLDLEIPDDDPLKRAKKFISTSAPGFRLFDKADGISWESDYVWLSCVNEEDGLDFRVLQTTDGNRELKAFWKEEELRGLTQLKDALEADPMWEVFRLRATALVQDRVEAQARLLFGSDEGIRTMGLEGTTCRARPKALAMRLRTLEGSLLEKAWNSVESEKQELAETETVKRYLNPLSDSRYEEEDFS